MEKPKSEAARRALASKMHNADGQKRTSGVRPPLIWRRCVSAQPLRGSVGRKGQAASCAIAPAPYRQQASDCPPNPFLPGAQPSQVEGERTPGDAPESELLCRVVRSLPGDGAALTSESRRQRI